MRDFACYLQNTAYRFLENYTKRIQANMEETPLKENNSSFEAHEQIFGGEEMTWPEDGEIWYDRQIQQQRPQFIRTTPSHSHDNAKLKQIITAAASEQHVITKLVINTNNLQQNQLQVEHELLKPPQQNRKRQHLSWLQQKMLNNAGGLLSGPTLSIAGDYAHLVELIVAIISVGIMFGHSTQDGSLFNSKNIQNTVGRWDWR
ncbi:unnamed protein product [Didymodactylos carnosus]|uniref:Uncharacterized protein n=1 Tax=Didymodactylos carnosus TaxID=1234261 RepID=A0A814A6Q4_9BILA|nr:unnamed protein product [Didymodactylos carnosus]CAF3689926.1 unnamed protein product [Didymodactylos carnosus]